MHPFLEPGDLERVADAVHAAVSGPTAQRGGKRC
jgi:hypothetical protein